MATIPVAFGASGSDPHTKRGLVHSLSRITRRPVRYDSEDACVAAASAKLFRFGRLLRGCKAPIYTCIARRKPKTGRCGSAQAVAKPVCTPKLAIGHRWVQNARFEFSTALFSPAERGRPQ